MNLVSTNVDQMQVLVIINNVGTKINVDANVKNGLEKEDAIKNLYGILVIVNMSVTNHVMLEDIQVMKTVNTENNQLISQSKNVVKILMKMK